MAATTRAAIGSGRVGPASAWSRKVVASQRRSSAAAAGSAVTVSICLTRLSISAGGQAGGCVVERGDDLRQRVGGHGPSGEGVFGGDASTGAVGDLSDSAVVAGSPVVAVDCDVGEDPPRGEVRDDVTGHGGRLGPVAEGIEQHLLTGVGGREGA